MQQTRIGVLALAVGFSLTTIAMAAPPTGSTGPGGFEATNAPSALVYWLDGSTGVTYNGTNVASWQSRSNGGLTFTAPTTAKQPLATTIGANGLTGFYFDGNEAGSTGNPLVAPNADELVLGSATSVGTFVAVNAPSRFEGLDGIWGVNNGDNGVRMSSATSWQTPGNGNDFTNPGGSQLTVNGVTNGSFALNSPHILAAVRAGSLVNLPQTSIGDYFQVGTNAARSYQGTIGEIVTYNRALNLAERQVLDNHLSAKYGIALGAGDVYAGDDPGNGNYDLNVFGIGRVNNANQLTAAGSAGLGIEAVSGFDDGEFVMAGHRTPNNSISLVGPDKKGISARAFYVDGTNLDGNEVFNVAFDFSDAGLTLADNMSDFELWFSNDPAFASFNLLAEDPIISGDTLLFNNVGGLAGLLQSGDGFLTVAFTVPEPGSLFAWSLLSLVGAAALVWRRSKK